MSLRKKSSVKKFAVSKDVKAFLNNKQVQRFAKKHPGMEGRVFSAFVLEMESGCTVIARTPLFTVKAAA